MLMIMTWEISLLVEHVVSMHGRAVLKPSLRIHWWPFYSCQHQYGPLNQSFACWHTRHGHLPVCPPHISRTLLYWLALLTKNMAAASHDYGTLNESKNVIPDHCDFTDYVNWPVYPVICVCVCVMAYLCCFLLPFQLWKHTFSSKKKKKKLWKLPVSSSDTNHRRIFLFFLLLSSTQHVHILHSCQALISW